MHPQRAITLAVRPFVQPFNDTQHLIRSTSVHEIDRTLTVEQAMLGVEPEARLFGIVEVGEPIGASLAGMPRPRKPASPFRYFNSSPEVIRLVVMMYVRFLLSLRNLAAMRKLGKLERREVGRWLNNRVENSHLPFRRREKAMQRFGG